jgi:hypothetical protein
MSEAPDSVTAFLTARRASPAVVAEGWNVSSLSVAADTLTPAHRYTGASTSGSQAPVGACYQYNDTHGSS